MKSVDEKQLQVLDRVAIFLSKRVVSCCIDSSDHFAKLGDVASGDEEVLVEQERVLAIHVIASITLTGASL